MANQTTMTHVSKPRERLLATAARLFYSAGIHSIGVDRILDEAGVTRATMYRHFAGKEALVAAYLEMEDTRIRSLFAGADTIDVVIERIAADVEQHYDRGCPFINAAAEYPADDSDVRGLVDRHRVWFREMLVGVATTAGLTDPAAAASSLVLLRDAALVGCYLDGVDVAAPAFRATARVVFA
ncbi:MAG: TetR/AcrR family transcriptional regulator [Thermoleophilia bacterium]|nr:TetR/AcrR family transcriptional regulator [Thermoleophilia bacterium]MCZ4496042.1 TetR/AcrR family transcriptional regulator [Thermoleophilia bacterium]